MTPLPVVSDSPAGIGEAIRQAAAADPDRVVLVEGKRRSTFRDLLDMADRFAAALEGAGVAPGERVAVLLPNCGWFAAVTIGAWKVGAVPMPLNPNLTASELAGIFRAGEPAAIVAGPERLAVARDAAGRVDGLAVRAWFTQREAEPAATALDALPPVAAPIWTDQPGDVAAILFTSGTSGRPRGVMLRHQGILFCIGRLAEMTPIRGETALCGLPLFHVYSLVLVLLAQLLRGGRVVLEPGFQFPSFLEVMARERVSTLMAVPPLLQLLVMQSDLVDKIDLSALRHVFCGGAPLSRALAERAEAVLGCAIHDGYGLTEMTLVALARVGPPVRRGSVGPPLDGVDVEIRDERGAVLPAGASGQIWVRSPALMKGYFRDEAATARMVVDGWFGTGDIGNLDADGHLYVTDRIEEIIFVGGLNVYPHEVEEVISAFPGVARVAVVAMKNEATGEVPQAYIVPQPGARIEIASLLSFVRGHLAPYKLPKRIRLVGELPTSPTGKILRVRLRDAT